MTKILIVFIIAIISSCSTDKATEIPLDKEGNSLVDSIDKYKYVDADCVGYGCDTTNLFRLFLRMQNKFNNNELVALCEHKNPTIQIYAFWTLCKRRYPAFKILLDKHINDKTQFMFNSGDTGTYYQINEFYLTIVDPAATVYDDCIKLSETDLKKYKDLTK